MTDEALRFWSKVNKTADCWLWTASRWSSGYGQFGRGGRALGAHRVSYEWAYGPIPTGMYVCHTCDTPLCVRPSHLFVGTPLDNVRDAVTKGRASMPPINTHLVGQRHAMAKLTRDQVDGARERYRAGGVKQKELAADYGVSRGTMSRILNERLWR